MRRAVRRALIIAIVLLAAVLVLRNAGRVLVVDQPEHADVIVVLDGEYDVRVSHGLSLLQAGYAPHLLLDASPLFRYYKWNETDLARRYIDELPLKERRASSVCPVGIAMSTMGEARAAGRCIDGLRAHSVLLVTSTYHTRRALSIFRQEVRGMKISVAAADDPLNFDVHWWRRRQWAKITAEEWVKYLWWECIDRWR
jgi:uncharacterized SAM-binding protein YcdF (DUF218 family)